MPRIIIAFVLFAGAIASAQETDSTRIREAGVSEYRSGHYAQAEGLLRRALAMAIKGNDQYGVALGYSALGDLYQATVRFREAEESYRKSISILSLWRHSTPWQRLTSGRIGRAKQHDC